MSTRSAVVLLAASMVMILPLAGAPSPIPALSLGTDREARQPFAPVPFRLEGPNPLTVPPAHLETVYGVRIDFPLGPVRIDYGMPLEDHVRQNGRFNFNGDFPGPGYREQRAAPPAQRFPKAGADGMDLLN